MRRVQLQFGRLTRRMRVLSAEAHTSLAASATAFAQTWFYIFVAIKKLHKKVNKTPGHARIPLTLSPPRHASPSLALPYLNASFTYLLEGRATHTEAFAFCAMSLLVYNDNVRQRGIKLSRPPRSKKNIYERQTKVNLDPAFIFQAIYFATHTRSHTHTRIHPHTPKHPVSFQSEFIVARKFIFFCAA